MKYEVFSERPKGRWGLFTRRTSLGMVNEWDEADFKGKADLVSVTLEQDTLVIRSEGQDPVEVIFGAEPQLRKPEVIEILGPDHPETRTGRSKVTVIPSKGRDRLVFKGSERQPLTLTEAEFRGLRMGVDLMRLNVAQAWIDGRQIGFNRGYQMGIEKSAKPSP